MSPRRATMRLQFHKGFTFADAERIVPYMAALGVSHLYASPIMTARAGSMHGYDVIDPTRVNPELGGEDALRSLVAALRGAGLGLIVDIVPNHMAVGKDDNPWWLDVLENGQASRYARVFDIDWKSPNPALHGKVLLPVLGKPYGEALAAGEIKVERDAARDRYVARYYDDVFPISPKDQAEVVKAPDQYDGTAPEGLERLHALLERQHYRLAFWKTAGDEINWRRFFDINELAGLRMEDDAVFETTHATLFRFYAEGLIDGVRVDHVDGLSNPGRYCRRLRRRLDGLALERPADAPQGPAYIVIEKILGPGETLPTDWDVDGTSGYDFMNEISALLHDPAGEQPLNALWERISGRVGPFEAEEQTARREILDRSFSAQRDAAVAAFAKLAQADLTTRDISPAALQRVLTELLVHFPVYRSYARVGDIAEADRDMLVRAFAAARTTALPGDLPLYDTVEAWMRGDAGADAIAQGKALIRFQQLSAPVAAKAVEDTAFYRYGRLLSRTDVGFDPLRFADTPDAFHAGALRRLERFPHAMLAIATHDHKRGEDVRARLAALSELPDEWSTALTGWIEQTAGRRHGDNSAAPSDADAAILFQTMVGTWPMHLPPDDKEASAAFKERLARWQEKALREAKLATDWVAPNETYEKAARDFLDYLFDDPAARALRDQIAAFAGRIAPAGAVNGLAQTLLKLTVPGVPDTYQGTEYWDLTLVDPDNRQPVDFAARQARLAAASSPADLLASWRDGRIKQAVIARTLAVRRSAPELFAGGDYMPLEAKGPRAGNVVTFARKLGNSIAIVVVPHLPARLMRSGGDIVFVEDAWDGTTIDVSALAGLAPLRDAFGGTEHPPGGKAVKIAELLREWPVAFLTAGVPTPHRS